MIDSLCNNLLSLDEDAVKEQAWLATSKDDDVVAITQRASNHVRIPTNYLFPNLYAIKFRSIWVEVRNSLSKVILQR